MKIVLVLYEQSGWSEIWNTTFVICIWKPVIGDRQSISNEYKRLFLCKPFRYLEPGSVAEGVERVEAAAEGVGPDVLPTLLVSADAVEVVEWLIEEVPGVLGPCGDQRRPTAHSVGGTLNLLAYVHYSSLYSTATLIYTIYATLQ